MRKKLVHKRKELVFLCVLALLQAACSTTGKLPEGEVLYAGIKEIAYDKIPTDTIPTKGEEGVITALVDAYNTVEGLLSGNSTMNTVDEKTEKQQEDSLKQAQKINKQAYLTAKSEVEAALAYEPNGSFMGSSYTRWPIRPKMWIYKKYLNSHKKFRKWMFDHFAATPKFISNVNPEIRAQVAKNTLKNYGYLRGTTSFHIIPKKDSLEAKVSYSIHPAELFSLDSITYKMYLPHADSIVQASIRKTLLHKGNPFCVTDLDGERIRLSEQFRNNGYYFFQPEYIVFRADTLQHPLKVQLQVLPSATMPEDAGKQYYMGNTYIRLMGYNDYVIVDTLERQNIKISYTGEKGKLPLHFGAMRRFLFYHKGDLYQQNIQKVVQDKLSGMGVFSQFKMNYIPRNDTLDVQISAMLDKQYDAEFEGKITTKSNGQIGPGAQFSMSKKNAFKGAGANLEDEYVGVFLSEGIGAIGESAFEGAKFSYNFEETRMGAIITIPESVQSIGARAFADSSACEIYFDGNPEIADDAFAGNTCDAFVRHYSGFVRQPYGGELSYKTLYAFNYIEDYGTDEIGGEGTMYIPEDYCELYNAQDYVADENYGFVRYEVLGGDFEIEDPENPELNISLTGDVSVKIVYAKIVE